MLAYNMKRVMAIIGVAALLEAWPPKPRNSARSNQCPAHAPGCVWAVREPLLFRLVLHDGPASH